MFRFCLLCPCRRKDSSQPQELVIQNENEPRDKRSISTDINTFRTQNLNCHNRYRAKHQVSSLNYNDELMSFAQNYANKLARTDSFQHSGGPYGENIFYSTANVDGNMACNSWYSEVQFYDYTKNNPPNFSQVGHFTQVVWKGSKNMGVGVATSRSGKTYVVANYSPPGNYQNQYRLNVLPPR